MTEQYVIVGGGLAGAMAAQTIREEGSSAPIVLIAAETERPYERPALSKAYLTGAEPREKVYVHPADWYAEHDVTLLTGVTATAIDPDGHTVSTDDGQRLPYTKLLLATGSTPRPLPVPGADLDGVLMLRTLPDADRLVTQLKPDRRIVVIGGGWIGLEVAAAARQAGADVTVVEVAALPLQRVLGSEVARVFAALHEANGVRLLSGQGVSRLLGTGRVEAVELADGTRLAADVVVVGVGVWSNVDIAAAAGLKVADGVLTDAALRASAPDVFAAGDIANAHHPLLDRPLRTEHWANARYGGRAAGRSMLGQDVVYDRIPYFYTDQYDLGMEYRGYAEPGGYDRVVFRGSTAIVNGKTPPFLVFWTQQGRVLAGMNVNLWDDGSDIERLVRAGYSGRPVDLLRLADPAIPLGTLLPD
jgi:3-phenylpropionate/trans-cinnamate dioxygenase ferredoxin reductase component